MPLIWSCMISVCPWAGSAGVDIDNCRSFLGSNSSNIFVIFNQAIVTNLALFGKFAGLRFQAIPAEVIQAQLSLELQFEDVLRRNIH